MARAERPFIETNVTPDVHACLKRLATNRGTTLREVVASILTDACSERSSDAPSSPNERPAPRWMGPRVQASDYARVVLRLNDDLAAGVPYERLQRPPIVDGDTTLPSDPEVAAVVFARELQLIRASRAWREMVVEGMVEAELVSPLSD